MMKNFTLIHAARSAYSVAGTVPCAVYDRNSRFAGLLLLMLMLMLTFVVIPPFFAVFYIVRNV